MKITIAETPVTFPVNGEPLLFDPAFAQTGLVEPEPTQIATEAPAICTRESVGRRVAAGAGVVLLALALSGCPKGEGGGSEPTTVQHDRDGGGIRNPEDHPVYRRRYERRPNRQEPSSKAGGNDGCTFKDPNYRNGCKQS